MTYAKNLHALVWVDLQIGWRDVAQTNLGLMDLSRARQDIVLAQHFYRQFPKWACRLVARFSDFACLNQYFAARGACMGQDAPNTGRLLANPHYFRPAASFQARQTGACEPPLILFLAVSARLPDDGAASSRICW